jgi:hypothetical protein
LPTHDPSLPPSIQHQIRLKTLPRRQWKITRNPALKAQIDRLQISFTRQLNEWRNSEWSNALESLFSEDQSLWKMIKRVMWFPTPSHTVQGPEGVVLSEAGKAEALVDSLKLYFNRWTTRRTRHSLG